jgi:hypothetical protein
MKRFFIIILLPVFFFFVLCSPKKENKPSLVTTPAIQKNEKKISINYVSSLWFGKSYSFVQSSLYSEKEKDKMSDELDKSNPAISLDSRNDTTLRKKFEEFGVVKGDELLLNEFKFDTKPNFTLKSLNEKEIKVWIHKDMIKGTENKIIVYVGKDSSETKANLYSHIKYAILDIIPGGNKEIIILNYHYLSNNELFYLDVYEIKTEGQ